MKVRYEKIKQLAMVVGYGLIMLPFTIILFLLFLSVHTVSVVMHTMKARYENS